MVEFAQICIFEGIADFPHSNQYVFLNLMYQLGSSKENRKHSRSVKQKQSAARTLSSRELES